MEDETQPQQQERDGGGSGREAARRGAGGSKHLPDLEGGGIKRGTTNGR